ncbi:hypothetical protein [Anaeromyxobacter dehalogenans]|nr:hypothetical protein [Anaeromyxobacter dehalogenans]ACL67352.1 hypothetical protein A2cp1_4034 [Anaeromyxobacter dehalogenans 2CP-1]
MVPDPGRDASKGGTLKAVLTALREQLIDPVFGPLGRLAWCRKQRRLLRGSDRSVVWVRGAAVEWAEWGARHGYFEVERMDGLSYLRVLGAPAA